MRRTGEKKLKGTEAGGVETGALIMRRDFQAQGECNSHKNDEALLFFLWEKVRARPKGPDQKVRTWAWKGMQVELSFKNEGVLGKKLNKIQKQKRKCEEVKE